MKVVPQISFHGHDVAMGEALPPVRAVRDLVARGAAEVALLDLDGVVAGDVLPQWVEAIVAVAGVPLIFDGRLHDGARIDRLARARFSSIVVDQRAALDPMTLRWALDLYGARLVAELQADGEYLFDPPTSKFATELVDVMADLHLRGARRLLLRDIGATEPSVQRLLELGTRVPGIRMIYQGPVHDLDHIAQVAAVGAGVEAVLVDARLVFDGAIDLPAAMRIAAAR